MTTPVDIGEELYPLQKALGYYVTAWSEDYARVEMELAEIHLNRHGIPHGGLYAVLMDTAAGYAGCWRPPDEPRALAMTLSLNVSFISVPRGKVLIAEGRRTGGGRNLFCASAELRDELGTLVATAAATLRYRQRGGDPTKRG